MKEKALTLYRRKHLGYVFQMYNLIPNLNVKRKILRWAHISAIRPWILTSCFHTLGLYEHRHKLPNQLSGGQQKENGHWSCYCKKSGHSSLRRAYRCTGYNTSKEILRLIEQVNQKYGNTIIMVTHNDAIKNMADRVVKLRDGQIRKNYLNESKVAADDLDW